MLWQGFAHVLSKHTTVSLADYVLRSAVPVRNDTVLPPPEYEWTGTALVEGLDELHCPESMLRNLQSESSLELK